MAPGALPPLAVALVFVDALRFAVFAYLWRTERAAHLRWWTLAFLVQSFAQLGVLFTLHGGPVVALEALILASVMGATLLLMRGTFALLARPWPAYWSLAGGAALVLGGMLGAVGAPLSLTAIFPMSFLAAAYATMAWAIHRSDGHTARLGMRMTVLALLMSALHFADFPFLSGIAWFVPWGLAIALCNEVALSVGFVLLHVDRTRVARDAAEVRYAELVETLGIGLFESDDDGRFCSVNPALVRLLGYDGEDELLALDPARDLWVQPDALERMYAAGTSVALAHPITWRRKDGASVELQLSGRIERSPKGRSVCARGFVVDRTEAARLEQKLRDAQKLDALGQLASGVAHDFNNLLAVIQASQLLLGRAPLSAPQREVLQSADEAVKQASRMTKRLLAFGGRQTIDPRVLDVGEVVMTTAKMLERTLAPRHTLDLSGVSRQAWALADEGQLEQVVLNLVLNARDAMPDGGTVTLAVRHRQRADKDGVELSVADCGTGIDPEHLRHIFDPFFTTKEPGRGTGLGLSTVHGIVAQAEGAIEVDSEPGRGACFRVWLPAAVPMSTPASFSSAGA